MRREIRKVTCSWGLFCEHRHTTLDNILQVVSRWIIIFLSPLTKVDKVPLLLLKCILYVFIESNFDAEFYQLICN